MKGKLAAVTALILCCVYVAAAGQRTFISELGDVNSVLGAQGKNIAVSENGEAIAVIYGRPTGNAQNPVELMWAYSLDFGTTWTRYGPMSGELERLCCAVDGTPYFDANMGELFFAWSEHTDGNEYGEILLRIEEGVPSASAPNTPLPLGIQGVSPCIAVSPYNTQHVLITFQCNNEMGYAMVSTDGGYTWTDTIPMGITGAPHVRFGDSNYVFATYHEQVDTLGSMLGIPFYVESMDGGFTWTMPEPLPVPFINPDSTVFLSSQFDCEVMSSGFLTNTPVAVHFDVGIDSLWLFWGGGSPGARTWDVLNVRELGACSLWQNDTLHYCYPSMYPSIAQDHGGVAFGVYYKGFHMTLASGDTVRNGAHIGGIHGWSDLWEIAPPISEPNTGEIAWDDWGVTEVAHLMTESPLDWFYEMELYSLWVHEEEGLYFERGTDTITLGIEEYVADVKQDVRFHVAPSITSHMCTALFYVPATGGVKISVYNVTGQYVDKLHTGAVVAGRQTIDIPVTHLSNGTYFAVLETTAGRQTAKFVVVK